ncbi:hypothetical protein UPYG_G00300070 [Umbra pygmaea]|uniref:Ubiquitin-like protease family profile domain-containing protein n=1 Tax=Umbra pygmaea TaxID=75934 RepID=A0ABD0WAK6_UMBPY
MLYFSACNDYSLRNLSTEEAQSNKEEKSPLSFSASVGQSKGPGTRNHPLEILNNHSQSPTNQKLLAIHSNSWPVNSASHERKCEKIKSSKPKVESVVISSPPPPSVAGGSHAFSKPLVCSDLSRPSVPSSDTTVEVHALPVKHNHIPSKCHLGPGNDTLSLKLSMARGFPLSAQDKRPLSRRRNIQFWLQRKWRTGGCLSWPSVIRQNQRVGKTRKSFRSHASTKTSGAHVVEVDVSQTSRKVRENGESVSLAISCDEQGLFSSDDSQVKGRANQKVSRPVGTSVLCGKLRRMTEDDCDHDKASAMQKPSTLLATKRATVQRKKPVLSPPQRQQGPPEVFRETLLTHIREFLNGFYAKFGSFIPLRQIDVVIHLKKLLNTDLTEWMHYISKALLKYRAALSRVPMASFRVLYNKHTLTLEDLSTLDHENWLNDQVINMYGDLIMESAQHKVHFFNSFFYHQLITKGYEGVKRWTRKVDLFSKALLLVPIHLEIHWCLVTANTITKSIHLYDSQGFIYKEAAENVLRYILTEAKEKKKTAFQSGWKMYANEGIPQQTNENDCGAFVLEYCRCLSLGKPLHFSQEDMPNVRNRIYRELCECKLQD